MDFVKNYRTWIVISVVLAVLAGVLTVYTVRSYVGTVRVMAAARDVNAGQVVEAGSLVAVDVPKGVLYPDAVRNASEVAGMVAKGYVPAGTILRKSLFVPPQAAGAAGRLSTLGGDFLAVAVPNSLYTTVAGVLQPGDRVDIYARAKDNVPPEKLAQDIQVLQAGTVTTKDGQQQTQGVVIALKQDELSRILPYLFGDQAKLVFVLKPVGTSSKEGASTTAGTGAGGTTSGTDAAAKPGVGGNNAAPNAVPENPAINKTGGNTPASSEGGR